MATASVVFNANQIRDFNTYSQTATQTVIRANRNDPSRLLDGDTSKTNPTHSDALQGDTITHWRATFEYDADHEVVPGSEVGIEFSVDGGATWRNFYDESNLEEDGYGKYHVYLDGGANGTDSGDEWISIVAIDPVNDPDGTGFMLSQNPISTGDLFVALNAEEDESNFSIPICFTDETLIETSAGKIRACDLKVGQSVRTQDHGFQPIRWIGRRHISQSELKANPLFAPVLICAGALGDGVPERDLLVSPHHRVLVRSKIAKRMFDKSEILIPAKELLSLRGVERLYDADGVDYIHFMFDNHEVVFANGAMAESLYFGASASEAMTEEAIAELVAIFPEFAEADFEAVPAREFISGAPARKMVSRHAQNNRSFVDMEGNLPHYKKGTTGWNDITDFLSK